MASITHLQKVLIPADSEGQHEAIVGGRKRARKRKNCQKKQPQGGLGAELENLRLQEQRKQEEAAVSPDHHGAI